MHSVQSTPLIGLPQFAGWSQVVMTSDHRMVWVFAVAGKNAGNIGRDCVSFIQDKQPQSAQELHTLITQLQTEVHHKDGELYLAAFITTPEEKLLLATVRGSIMLRRGNKTGTLIPASTPVTVMEGRLSPGDIFVVSTEQATQYWEEIQQKLMQGYDVDTIITSLVPTVHGSPDSSLSALAFLSINTQREAYSSFGPAVPSPDQSPLNTPPISLAADVNPAVSLEDLDETELPPSLTAQTATPLTSAPLSSPPSAGTWPPTPPQWRPPTVAWQDQSRKLATGLGKGLVQGWRALRQGSQSVRSRLPSGNAVYVTPRPPKQLVRRLFPWVVLAVIGLSLIGIWWSRQQQQRQTAAQAIAPIHQLVTSAQAQVDTNILVARQQVQQAITELETLEKSYDKQPVALKMVREELTQARQLHQQISGQEEVTTLDIFHNLSLVKSDFLTTAAETTDDQAWFVDAERKEVIGLNLENKSAQTRTLDTPTPRDLTVEGTNVVVLAEGLRRFTPTSTAAATVIKDNNDQLSAGTAIGAFGRFLYVLNPEKRELYRLTPNNGSYGDPTAWFRGAVTLDFAQVASMSIDGDIWLGLRDGQIKRFRSGREIAFTIEGLADPFQNSLIVYTRENVENLYVLEANKQRLVILSKEGKFIREVKSPALASATALIVSEKRKLALPVSGALLYKIDL